MLLSLGRWRIGCDEMLMQEGCHIAICLLRIGRKTNLVLTLIGMLFFNLVSAITTEFAVYVLARYSKLVPIDHHIYFH